MEIQTLVVGGMAENCYIVSEGGSAVVIDPGEEAGRILDTLEQKGLKVTHILLTHGHYDHIGGVGELRAETGAPVCIHQEDAEMLVRPEKNLSAFLGAPGQTEEAECLLEDGQMIQSGSLRIQVLHTPGHTPGGVCFAVGDALFTGDTLFALSVGRTDFPGSSWEALEHSLNQVLAKLTADYRVYPGHGPATTLAEEKKNNPYLRG